MLLQGIVCSGVLSGFLIGCIMGVRLGKTKFDQNNAITPFEHKGFAKVSE